ncbi:MAG: SCO family protein, partial [Betaproteobacteria bacterium]|nr:SCO family protein [Betaproteobacteria bacterium]
MNKRTESRKFAAETRASRPGFPLKRFIASVTMALAISGCVSEKSWHVEDVAGHLPDLSFSLVSDRGGEVTARTYEGYLLLMYFGFTRCNAECPVSMARLARVAQLLGNDASRVRILFVTLDPARDTPPVLHRYVTQFDPVHAVGLTGTTADIERLAKQYRAAYRPRSKIDEAGNIEHGDAVYIFDIKGEARLLATSSDSDEHLA